LERWGAKGPQFDRVWVQGGGKPIGEGYGAMPRVGVVRGRTDSGDWVGGDRTAQRKGRGAALERRVGRGPVEQGCKVARIPKVRRFGRESGRVGFAGGVSGWNIGGVRE